MLKFLTLSSTSILHSGYYMHKKIKEQKQAKKEV